MKTLTMCAKTFAPSTDTGDECANHHRFRSLGTTHPYPRLAHDQCRGGSHIGAIFSCADILAVLYGGVLHVDPEAPRHPDRDRFVLSKGHAGGGLYAALAERGFFPVEKLLTHYQNGSELSGHVSHALRGVEVSTGALGHGPLRSPQAWPSQGS